MQVLVTGGAGYIGSHVVELLLAKGYTVVVYDNLCAGYRAAVHPDATFIRGDLLNPGELAACFEQHSFDGILHFASHIAVGESMLVPFKYLRDNPLTDLPDGIAALPNLEKLDLRWNHQLVRQPSWEKTLEARGCVVYL